MFQDSDSSLGEYFKRDHRSALELASSLRSTSTSDELIEAVSFRTSNTSRFSPVHICYSSKSHSIFLLGATNCCCFVVPILSAVFATKVDGSKLLLTLDLHHDHYFSKYSLPSPSPFKELGNSVQIEISTDKVNYGKLKKMARHFKFKLPDLPKIQPNAEVFNIPLERKCIREDASVGGSVIHPMIYAIFNVTAYACVLSDTFSLLEDMRVC